MNKPLEYWAVIAGMVLYVATRDAEKEAIWRRAVKTVSSALLTVGLSPTLAPYVRGSEVIAAVGIMAFSILVLDIITALITDREFMKRLVAKRLGLDETSGGDDA